MKYDTQELALAIRNAVKLADEFSAIDDGGTCNLDSAYLRVPGMREAQAKEIEKMAGIPLSLATYSLHGRILQLVGGTSGQGNRRTKMAEVECKYLKSLGFDASVYYQMD